MYRVASGKEGETSILVLGSEHSLNSLTSDGYTDYINLGWLAPLCENLKKSILEIQTRPVLVQIHCTSNAPWRSMIPP